jgi:hypothetical protein
MTQQQLNNLLKEGNTLKKEALSLLEQETKGNAALAAEFKKSNKEYKDIVSKLKEINGEITEAKKKQSDRISTLMQEEQKLKGLSGIQASFVGLERDRIKLMSKSDSMNSSTRDKLSSIRSLNDELLGLSAEDEVSKAVIEQKIQDIMKGMKGLGADAQAQLDIEKEKFDKAKNLSSLTEKQQGLLNKQMAVYEGMKDTIGGILETASLLSKTVGGVLGGALIGAGYAAEAIGKNVREFGGFLGMATVQTTALGLVFDDAAAVSKTLANEFAGVEGTSFRTQLNTNLMAVNMGISGESAAKLTGILARSGNLTAKQAQDLAQQTKDFAKQQGVIPSQAMEDIAQNAELFASYGAIGNKRIS